MNDFRIPKKDISRLDLLASSVTNNFKFYRKGAGDLVYLDDLEKETQNPKRFYAQKEIKIEWIRKLPFYFADSWRGEFISPYADHLPDHAKKAEIEFLRPKGFDENTPVCIHLAATGDEGFNKRLLAMAVPLLNSGIASIILEIPMYGARKPPGQFNVLLNTFSDFFRMLMGTIHEGISLAHYFHGRGHKKIAITGVSMGGSMAAVIASVIDLEISAIPCLAAHSPEPVFMEGLLFDSIDWKAMERDLGSAEKTEAFARRKLSLCDITKLSLPKKVSASILVSGENDGYVFPKSAELLHNHWKTSELRWVNTGHVGSILYKTGEFRKAIIDSIKKLNVK